MTSTSPRGLSVNACRLAGMKPDIRLESRSPHTLLAMAEAGHGVAIHRRLAYVPGDVTLWPNLTGGEIVDLGLGERSAIGIAWPPCGCGT